MTRKDYIALADALADALIVTDLEADTSGARAIEGVMYRIKAVLRADNPRFDGLRFSARVQLQRNKI